MMEMRAGAGEKIESVGKLAKIVEALIDENVSVEDALHGVQLTPEQLHSPDTVVSFDQVSACCHNAIRLSRDPHFAYRAGLRIHVTTYGMYGFTLLSSGDFRQMVRFAVDYHLLAMPTAALSFGEENGRGIWTITPLADLQTDPALHRFLAELQFGICVSLHRDVMGVSFEPHEFQMSYASVGDVDAYRAAFGCNANFNQPQNRLLFDAGFLDKKPDFSSRNNHSTMTRMCDDLLQERKLQMGLRGKIREIFLPRLADPPDFEEIAERLHMTERTLRRRLREEGASYREMIDELRMHVAIKYLSDTHLTVEDIAVLLGFSEAANFRQAFHRWTGKAPRDYRPPVARESVAGA